MTNESSSQADKTSNAQRGRGRGFEADSQSQAKPQSRRARVFSPEAVDGIEETPETITAGERLPHVSEYSSIKLETLPVKGVKSLAVTVAILFVVLVGWDFLNTYRSLVEVHAVAGVAFLVLIALAAGSGVRLWWRFRHDKDSWRGLEGIRQLASRLRGLNDKGNAKELLDRIKLYNRDKPQALYLKTCLDQLPDYSNDREVVEHLDRGFLQPLDNEALSRVSKYSLQTGLAVAASPWASLDMALSLWRNLKLIDDVAQVYGVRPSLVNRLKLIKRVLHHLAFVGTTEIVIDQMSELGMISAGGMASARAAQGIGASIYTARIGLAAMNASRPFEFLDDQRPKTKALLLPIVRQLASLNAQNNKTE
tara:strand:+ start:39953 stop:41050 length:1098 start_codon:yes stop_codon:yes gene_type:complete